MNYNNIFQEIVNSVNMKHSYKWDDYKKDIAVREFQRFMRLKVKHNDYNHTLLSPGPVIDNIWHEFLLRPANYYNYCMLLSGKIIDHSPIIDDDVITRYKNTLYHYNKEYSVPPPEYIWPPVKQKQELKYGQKDGLILYIIDNKDPENPKTIKFPFPNDVSYKTLRGHMDEVLNLCTRDKIIKEYSNEEYKPFTDEDWESNKKMKYSGNETWNKSRYGPAGLGLPNGYGC
jgi:hypothetical protein